MRIVLAKGVLVSLCCIMVGVAGCRRSGSTSTSAPIASPDGKYSLVTSVNQSKTDPTKYLCVILEIHDAQGILVGKVQTGASDRMRWNVAWDSKNRIWLKSADIGTHYCELQADGQWKMFGYAEQKRKGQAPTPPSGMP